MTKKYYRVEYKPGYAPESFDNLVNALQRFTSRLKDAPQIFLVTETAELVKVPKKEVVTYVEK